VGQIIIVEYCMLCVDSYASYTGLSTLATIQIVNATDISVMVY